MAKKTNKKENTERWEAIEKRLDVLENTLAEVVPFPLANLLAHLKNKSHILAKTKESREEKQEQPVAPWKYLVSRPHPWRTQLYIMGRNMTARQLVGSMKANELNEENAGENHSLPVEAIREALNYVEQNKELLETEAEIERLMLKRGGTTRGPQSVS